MKVSQPGANRPIYIIAATDPSVKGKIQYYRASKVTESGSFLDIYGHLVDVAQIKTLKSSPREEPKEQPINRKVPYTQIIFMDSITYNKITDVQNNGE